MSLHRLQQLAREARFEPCRERRNTEEPEMVGPGVKELSIRLVPGCRTYAAIAGDGVVVAFGILEPGGDERALCTELSATLSLWTAGRGMLIAV